MKRDIIQESSHWHEEEESEILRLKINCQLKTLAIETHATFITAFLQSTVGLLKLILKISQIIIILGIIMSSYAIRNYRQKTLKMKIFWKYTNGNWITKIFSKNKVKIF
ncbi:hypothetical protein DMUE_5899 [Dictyocoela muelleri]|nr:hypothetical protein DMUE_5899 [Dictyocoela muelleri]